ncbi:MAG: hypothetical protein Q7K43_01955 [Candidatus Woesearchaeota archaeon]|nr:hypothetical protein [Candidatus Woesearchaeota archaeon]
MKIILMVAILRVIKQAYSTADSLAFGWYRNQKAEQEAKRQQFLARNEYCMNALRNAKNNLEAIEFKQKAAQLSAQYTVGVQTNLIKKQTDLISKLEQKIASVSENVIETSLAKLEVVGAYHANISLPVVAPIKISPATFSISVSEQETPESATKYKLNSVVNVAKEYVANAPLAHLSALDQITQYGAHITSAGFAIGIGAIACASSFGLGAESSSLTSATLECLASCGIATLASVPVALVGASMTESYQRSVSAVQIANETQAKVREELKLPLLESVQTKYSSVQEICKLIKSSITTVSEASSKTSRTNLSRLSSFMADTSKSLSQLAIKYSPTLYLARMLF